MYYLDVQMGTGIRFIANSADKLVIRIHAMKESDDILVQRKIKAFEQNIVMAFIAPGPPDQRIPLPPRV